MKLGMASMEVWVAGISCGRLEVRVIPKCDCATYQKSIDHILDKMKECKVFSDRLTAIQQQLTVQRLNVVCVEETALPGIAAQNKSRISIRCNTPLDLLYGALALEVLNAEDTGDHEELNKRCAAGQLSRADYIKAVELQEYANIAEHSRIVAACGWPKVSNFWEQQMSSAWKDSNAYLADQLANGHSEQYGRAWDSTCKVAFEAAQKAKDKK